VTAAIASARPLGGDSLALPIAQNADLEAFVVIVASQDPQQV
jgi:hypothetical protein